MTGNISYLSDFEEINRGYVAFGRNPKGGKITDTERVVLSSDFKLPDENHVLLTRENNMYNVDLNNVVPLGDLTCLFCNLVRGLPSKVFENNHTCVACKKGKQHRASASTNDDNAADKEVNAAEATVFNDEEQTMTMAQTLIKRKVEKARLLDEHMAKRLHDEEIELAAAKEN
nr:hypothetical protein [Tanacetum cinerariifolium]